jgi:hypothetical protein
VERLLLLWDELDDIVAACRHVAVVTADEVVSLPAPIAAAATSLAAALLGLASHLHAALSSGASIPWIV